MEQPAYYAILTANVRYDNRLTADEKILYAEITALSNKNGYCSASNAYFANLYEVAKETISRRMSKLSRFGYIKIELIKKGKQIKQRRIYLLTHSSVPIDATINSPIDETINSPIDANIKENNTSINTTRDNITSSNKDIMSGADAPDDVPAQVIEYLNQKAKKKFKPIPGNVKFINARIKEGYELDDFIKVVDVKVKDWIDDKRMNSYLRPSTLFNSEKFEAYLNEADNGVPEVYNPYANIY